MVLRVRGYYETVFQDPLSPTIFNVVVSEVVWNYVKDMAESSEELGGRGQ